MLYTKILSFNEIILKLKLINNSYLLIGSLVIFSILVFILIFYILPILQVYFKVKKDNKESTNRKKLLNQIIIQKDIENEVEEEIKKLNLKG